MLSPLTSEAVIETTEAVIETTELSKAWRNGVSITGAGLLDALTAHQIKYM